MKRFSEALQVGSTAVRWLDPSLAAEDLIEARGAGEREGASKITVARDITEQAGVVVAVADSTVTKFVSSTPKKITFVSRVAAQRRCLRKGFSLVHVVRVGPGEVYEKSTDTLRHRPEKLLALDRC